MADDMPKADPKVKQLLERDLGQPLDQVVDAVTAAELQKWFGLPSYQQVQESEKAAALDDPEVLALRERRAKAIEAVDPAFLASHLRRTEPRDDLLKFRPAIELRVDPSVALFDHAMADRGFTMGEPRDRELPEQLADDLHDCTPQALLRDLHRPETMFEKMFEVIDAAASQRFDIVAEVAAAMTTNWKLPPLGPSPFRASARELDELRIERKRSWPTMFAAQPLPNRRVRE
jgi:hypothetical protein